MRTPGGVFVTLLLLAAVHLASARVRGIKSSPCNEKAEVHRRLTQLVGYGAEPESQHFPLQLCEGDCDCDHECDEGLVCFQRDAGYGPIPSCLDGENFNADSDFCVPASSTRSPSQMPSCPGDRPATVIEPAVQVPEPTAEAAAEDTAAPTITPNTDEPTKPLIIHNLPPLVFAGDSYDIALSGRPLGLCTGDCDTDQDCLDELLCFQRDLLEPVPGCYGSGLASIDYCIKPLIPGGDSNVSYTPVTGAPTTEGNTNDSTLPLPTVDPNLPPLQTIEDNPKMPLGLCQGDCDNDDDCLDELICFQREYLEIVPGCSGQGTPSYDYCIAPLGGSAGLGNVDVTACTNDALTCPDGSFVVRSPPSCTFPECPQVAACLMDVMMCPDGTSVSRTPPSCEFEECPNDSVACTMEVVQCEDGSFVGREGPNCDFAVCPEVLSEPCPAEQFTCPDGTLVKREGPDCAFQPCAGGVVVIASGQEEGTSTDSMTVAQIILGSTVHTTLVNLIADAVLVRTLNQEGTYTMFAPTDTAFILNGIDNKYTTEEWSQHLVDIVTYHVTSSTIKSSDLEVGSILMLNGEEAQVSSLSPPMLNNAYSTSPAAIVDPFDIEGSNGALHSIDAILRPTCATKNIADIIAEDPNYSVLYTLITAADLNLTLKGEGPYTVFAPTNDGFDGLSSDDLTFLTSPAGKDQLVRILLYHVTPGNLYVSMLTNREVETLQGEIVTIVADPPVMVVNARVVGDQVLAANGVIHPIDEVLTLPELPMVQATATSVTAAPSNAPSATAIPALSPVSLPPISPPALPGDETVVVIGAQEAPLPMLQVVESKDDKYNGKDKDKVGVEHANVLSAMELLGECQGDCDDNEDCTPGLVCVDAKGLTAIPGCQGTPDGYTSYCAKLN